MRTKIWPLAALLMLLGCSNKPPASGRPPQPPEQWAFAQSSAAVAVSKGWWHDFASAELDRLIAQAQTQSYDIAAAMARVRQADASARQAGALLLPQLDANLVASREGRIGGNADVDGNRYSAGVAANYEVDLWGRLSASRDSALFALNASVFDRAAVQLTLTASVASTWLQSVGLSERLRIAALNLANAERVLATVESRQRAGAATSLELAQQRGVVAAQRRTLADLRQQVGDSQTALALLLGQHVSSLALTPVALDTLGVPTVDAGLPSELITRRPDIAQAEAQLAAADADVLAARAALLPRLSLTATVGGSAGNVGDVFSDPLYSLASALTAPIFSGGRLAAEHDLAVARREELLAGYQRSIVAAFADVEVALNGVAGAQAQQQAQNDELDQAQLAFRLSESRYRSGADTLLTLLDTQRTLFAAQDQAAQLKLARLQASVALYRALGGGWRVSPQPL